MRGSAHLASRVLDLGLGGPADVVVLAPHPDDEVFGVAALMCGLVAAGHRLRVVAVSDGEAAYGPRPAAEISALVARRVAERRAALRRLGIADAIEVVRLRLPDGRISAHLAGLTEQVAAMAPTVIVATWRHDGHPDHEAVGEAAASAAVICGARLLEYPVWASHRGRLDSAREAATATLVPMSVATRHAKVAAARLFRSQLEPSPDGNPVVPQTLIDALAGRDEVVFE